MSCLMCHISRVICHMSRVTCHVSWTSVMCDCVICPLSTIPTATATDLPPANRAHPGKGGKCCFNCSFFQIWSPLFLSRIINMLLQKKNFNFCFWTHSPPPSPCRMNSNLLCISFVPMTSITSPICTHTTLVCQTNKILETFPQNYCFLVLQFEQNAL